MSSFSFNSTSASALSLLTGTTANLQKTTIKVASGKEVGTAADNAAYWSIATTMSSDSVSLSTAEDASGLAAAKVDTASLGIEAATGIVSEIQSKLILAKSTTVGRDAINAEITQLKSQLGTIAESTSFSGENWLSTEAGTAPAVKSMVASVTTAADGSPSVNTIEYDTAQSVLVAKGDAQDGILTGSYAGTTQSGSAYDYYLLDSGSTTAASGSEISVDSSTSDDEIDGMILATDAMMSRLADAGASLGATSTRITGNTEFLQDLQDTVQIGIGRLVDADLEEKVTKLAAYKAQQQLQIISLNIANDQSKTLLSLYR